MRLARYLASKNIASRRKSDELIKSGRIKINENLAQIGQKLTDGDTVFFDNQLVGTYKVDSIQKTQVIAFHKPINVLCSKSDPQNRSLIFDFLPKDSAITWIIIGRLDFKTTGLILATNCGELAHKLMHPSFRIEREYKVKIKPFLSPQDQKKILNGIELEDGIAKAISCSIVSTTKSGSWVTLSLHDGRNREVRRIFKALNYDVIKLQRISYGNVSLGNLKSGEYRFLTDLETKSIG